MIARMGRRYQAGVSLIELMVAMVLGLVVAGGIISVFISTSSSNRVQTQLARLQEEGRFAITRIVQDVSLANGQYCTNTGGTARLQANGTYLDGLRAPTVYTKNLQTALLSSDLTTRFGVGSYPAAPAASYTFPSFLSMRGYDCTVAACTPVDPNTIATTIPPMGKAIGNRVPGSAVLTLRYVDSSSGWAIGNNSTISSTSGATGSTINSISLVPGPNEPAASTFKGGDLAMLADCSGAQIFSVNVSGGVLTPDAANNFTAPTAQQPQSAPKVFDFNHDYLTVTYYLQVVDNGNGQTTGALVRQVNGNDANKNGSQDQLVRGIERLDFRYGVEDSNGNTSYLTANQVDTGTNCPPSAPNPLLKGGVEPGCMWRAIKSIQVSILMNGQVPLYTLGPTEMQYSYSPEAPAVTGPQAPSAHTIKPSDQGFVDQLVRREFNTVVSVRNFNP
ncbi:MAG TPA: PilW family protein [Dyella sp.]|uniref:PilW family protein n=1 Tax=Dyella sp. TaxID=1869338 RepID=UPI002F93E6E1